MPSAALVLAFPLTLDPRERDKDLVCKQDSVRFLKYCGAPVLEVVVSGQEARKPGHLGNGHFYSGMIGAWVGVAKSRLYDGLCQSGLFPRDPRNWYFCFRWGMRRRRRRAFSATVQG